MWEEVPAVREVVIGAWSHTGEHGASLGVRSVAKPSLKDQTAHAVDFLRRHADAHGAKTQGTAAQASTEARILRYFVMGTDVWHDTHTWPPPGVRSASWILHSDGSLSTPGSSQAPGPGGWREHTPDPRATTGTRNRWHTQNAHPVSYGTRAATSKRLLWRTAPVQAPLRVVGEGELHMTLCASYNHAAVFAYLELVNENGRVFHATEGIGTCERSAGEACELRLKLLPTAFQVPAGWSLQLVLAGTDAHTFPVSIPAGSTWTVGCGGGLAPASELSLPIVPPDDPIHFSAGRASMAS